MWGGWYIPYIRGIEVEKHCLSNGGISYQSKNSAMLRPQFLGELIAPGSICNLGIVNAN